MKGMTMPLVVATAEEQQEGEPLDELDDPNRV
jgi:hypothetical protein